MVSNKIQIISCIISVASIFISYFLGRLESKRKYISSVKKDRYYNLYSPYIELLNSLEIEGIDLFVEFPSMKILRKRNEFITLLRTQLKYLDERTLSYYYDFAKIYIDFNRYPSISLEYAGLGRNIPKESKEKFCLLTISLLEEATILSNELKLPSISKLFLTKYHRVLNENNILKQSKSN